MVPIVEVLFLIGLTLVSGFLMYRMFLYIGIPNIVDVILGQRYTEKKYNKMLNEEEVNNSKDK